MNQKEYEELVRENIQTTLGRHFGFDAVVDELSRRVSANVIALINVLEIEDACPVCGTVMPDTASVSPQVLFEGIYESLKKTADRWISMGDISIRSADAIYAMLGEMGREASQKAIAIFISERAKGNGTGGGT